MQKISFQLYDVGAGGQAGAMITDTGGKVQVNTAGDASKATIYDAAGAAITTTSALSLTNGGYTFYVADSVASVDLYIMAPGGQFVVRRGAIPGMNEIAVDTRVLNQVAVIPFSASDSTAAAEKDTGFDLPLYSQVMPFPAIRVTTIDATETIDVGLLSSETAGDADGFLALASVATAGLVKGTIINGTPTLGALMYVQDSANAGDESREGHVITGSNATSITYTLTAGSDTAEGFIFLQYQLSPI